MRIGLVVAALCAASIASITPSAARAQGGYPDKTITMIVPFPPGGVADTVARPVAEALARELKQSVVVENKAGAGGALGIGMAARAAPDGYTLLLSLSSISILPEADSVLQRKPAYTLDQFKPIARFTADPTVFVVRADAPWKTLAEFIADAKRRPGALNYGSSGNYGTMHVPMEMLKSSADFRMTHIPYTGAGPAVVALLAGQVDAIATGPSTIVQQIQTGKLRALAVTGKARLQSLPNVPTAAEVGLPKLDATSWFAVFAPAKTPKTIVDKLAAEIAKVMATPAFKQKAAEQGAEAEFMDPQHLNDYSLAELTRWGQVVKASKIEAD